MTRDRWQEVEALFQDAIALAPQEQENFLLSRSTDADVLDQVRSMLRADRDTGDTIGEVVGRTAVRWLEWPADQAPERAGAWRLVQPLGSGGMGTVYLAARDDDAYRQLAAVKILRRDTLATGSMERFRQERQILAELEHANIARLLDGGTLGDGRPYLVIEYVDGERLTDHAAKLRVPERCALFAVVCDAVAYAHRNLIVHRDLKPANVMVDRNGNPKLLDFGIAKLVGIDRQQTMTSTSAFTPDYASPEQLLGEPITTATDVYALGAILYELLAGQPARSREHASLAELVREVTERDPSPPSRVSQERIPADLDRIVAKAMSRDPQLRYGTADQLAADVRRFLLGLPVEARGASFFYVASKFARRHWLPVAAAVLLAAGLTASAVWSQRLAKAAEVARGEAERERERAEKERLRAEEALAESIRQRSIAEENAAEAARQRKTAQSELESNYQLTHRFLFDFEQALGQAVGVTPARQLLVKTSLEHLERMGRTAGNDPKIISDLAMAYDRTGDVQGYQGTANLGNLDGALASYEKSLAWRRKLLPRGEARLFAGYTLTKVATVLTNQDRATEAEVRYEEASRLLDGLGPGLHEAYQKEAVLYRANLARARAERAQNARRHDKAAGFLLASIADISRGLQTWPDHAGMRRSLANQHLTLARSLLAEQRYAEALHHAESSWKQYREILGPNPVLRDQSRLLSPGIILVDVLEHAPAPFRDLRRALTIDAEIVGISERLVALDQQNARYKVNLVLAQSRQAGHLRGLNRLDEAVDAYQRSNTVAEALLRTSPQNAQFLDLTAVNYVLTGLLHFERRDFPKAKDFLTRAAGMMEKYVKSRPGALADHLTSCYRVLAEIACEERRDPEAAAYLAREREILAMPRP